MRPAILALALALACKSGGSSAQPKGAGGEPGSDGTTPAGTAQDGPAGARGKTGTTSKCAPSGRPWDGKLQGCIYEHDGCCYDSFEAVCAAAGCDGPCHVEGPFSPAQVRCDEQPDPATP
jgi:hypothetical protein